MPDFNLKTRAKFPIRTLSKAYRPGAKLGIFGHIGTGKTNVISGALEYGEKVLAVSTDFGGDGFDTVADWLTEKGKADLLENFRGERLGSYAEAEAFFKDPRALFSAEDLEAFAPTTWAWDGASSFQIHDIDEHILSFDSGTKGEMRDAGLVANERDWDAFKRLTLRALINFIALGEDGVDGQPPAKIVTFLQNQKEDKQTHKIQEGPLLQGAARGLAGGGFDIMAQALVEKDKTTKKLNYKYRLRDDSERYAVKVRGRSHVPPIIDADPLRLWKILRKKDQEEN